ncbi:M3 family metallopeptidase [Shewanella sp.]|uniref:M3 family metallopeptidase n=1 Tax=Shewanella sp. TaxID=50422 RepID=UPI003F3564F7
MLIPLLGLNLSVSHIAHGSQSPVALLIEQCLRLPDIQLATAFINENATTNAANTHSAPTAGQDGLVAAPAILPVEIRAVILERQTIGLNNINDRLNYYRRYPLNQLERQGLLQCQLHLADNLGQLVTQAEFKKLAQALNQGDPEHLMLAAHLNTLLENHLAQDDKAKLHMAQANIGQALSDQELNLTIAQGKCQLPSAPPVPTADLSHAAVNLPLTGASQHHNQHNQHNDDNHHKDKLAANSPAPLPSAISTTIAQYLLKQDNAECRRQVWQAYQSRAKSRSQAALSSIVALRQQAARAAGFTDFTTWRLQRQYLATRELVNAFLASQTQSIKVAPWDLGRHLAALPAANGPERSGVQALAHSFSYLSQFGLRFEPLNPLASAPTASSTQAPTTLEPTTPNPRALVQALSPQSNIRVYHHQRLLGELYIQFAADSNNASGNHHYTLRQGVIGQQFGQHALHLQLTLKNYRELESFTQALAQAITALARGSHFYLNNTQGPSLDSHQLPSLWLARGLREALFPEYESEYLGERERLALAYQKQLTVFRAKLALRFYQSPPQPNDNQLSDNTLSQAFELSFGEPWPPSQDTQFNELQYSFAAIADEGPRYYQGLWQTELAQLMYEATAHCQDQASLFERLVVNESGRNLTELLQLILGRAVSPQELIDQMTPSRLNHSGSSSKRVTPTATCITVAR